MHMQPIYFSNDVREEIDITAYLQLILPKQYTGYLV